jgi:hypothetical protein
VLYFYDDREQAEKLVFKDQLPFDRFSDVVLHPSSKQEGTRFDLILSLPPLALTLLHTISISILFHYSIETHVQGT